MSHHHHPTDPNAGVVRGHLDRHVVLVATLAAAVTVVALALLGLVV